MLKTVMERQALNASDACDDTSCQVEIRKLVQAQKMITAGISKLELGVRASFSLQFCINRFVGATEVGSPHMEQWVGPGSPESREAPAFDQGYHYFETGQATGLSLISKTNSPPLAISSCLNQGFSNFWPFKVTERT
jgi:hypothetical protein